MAKASKATKKFQHRHLKHTIEHRREVQKHNKKYGDRKKKQAAAALAEENAPPKQSKASKEVFEDMSVEDFFAGGFEVPKEKKSKKPVEDEESSEEEDEEMMKQDLENLEEKDPEFYKYLKSNDKDLLDFEGVDPMDAVSDDESEAEEEEETEESKKEKEEEQQAQLELEESQKTEITVAITKKWKKELETPSLNKIRKILIAFKAAVNSNKSAEVDYKYLVTDPNAFNQLMFLALKDVPEAVQKLIPYKVTKNGARSIPSKNEFASKLAPLLKSQAGCYITLLNDITNIETAAMVLSSLYEILPFYLSYRKVLKVILNSVVDVWSTATGVEIQIASFAFLNNACKEFPQSVLQVALKSTYSTFLQNCRKTNVHNMPKLNFCKNSAAEVFGIDEDLSYQVGFEYVRQLAIHLRNSISATSSAKEGYKTIYNWQYCHSLDFWSRILSKQCNPEIESEKHKSKESPLRQLIYPLVQVTLGAIKLIPTAQFFPLRFYLIRSLIRLSQNTGTYIPIFPLISEVLTSTAITKAPKRSNLAPFDFEHNIKVNQQYLGTKVYQDGLCEEFIELTSEFFVLYSKSIAFPELVTPAVLALRRFTKKSKNPRFNKSLQQLIEKLNANANLIISKRSIVEYGPSNKIEVQRFLNDLPWEKTPLGQYVSVQREAKEQKARLFRQALEEEEKAEQARKEKSTKEEQEDDEVDMAVDAIVSGDESE